MATKKTKRRTAPNQGSSRRRPQAHAVQATRRTTPAPEPTFHFRPTWHKAVALVLLVSGLGLFVSCEANIGDIHNYGGHVWFIVGLIIAASSSWWFGIFDEVPKGF